METKHSVVLNTPQRVQRFMDTNADALGTLNTSGYRRILDEVAGTLSGHAVNQAASQRVGSGETAKQRVLRSALKLNHMRPIASVAAAQLKQVLEFTALRMPPANSTSRQLIAAAGALNESVTNRGTTRTIQSGATAGVRAEAARGRDAVKVLDSLIEPQLSGSTVLLVQWRAARRFGGKTTPIPSTTIDAAAKGPAAAGNTPASGSSVGEHSRHLAEDADRVGDGQFRVA